LLELHWWGAIVVSKAFHLHALSKQQKCFWGAR
jgi:hypothetical protein